MSSQPASLEDAGFKLHRRLAPGAAAVDWNVRFRHRKSSFVDGAVRPRSLVSGGSGIRARAAYLLAGLRDVACLLRAPPSGFVFGEQIKGRLEPDLGDDVGKTPPRAAL